MLVFDHPSWFLLIPLPWLLWKWLPHRGPQSAAVRVPFGDRIDSASRGMSRLQTGRSGWMRKVSTSLVWCLVVCSLALPQRLEPPVSRQTPTRDLLLLVDLSASMKQSDFQSPDGKPIERLDAVKQVVGDFLIQREGDRVGLVVFGNSPFLQAPFSTDLDLSEQLLDETAVGMAGPKTAFGDAIGFGINLFDGSDVPAKTIIALTDGNDTASQVPPVEAARVAKDRGIRIHTVAIGDPESVGEDKLDQETLRQVATSTGGAYFYAGDRAQLDGIYDELDEIETREIESISYRPRQNLFYVPLLIAAMIWMVTKVSLIIHHARQRHFAGKVVGSDERPVIQVDAVSGKLRARA